MIVKTTFPGDHCYRGGAGCWCSGGGGCWCSGGVGCWCSGGLGCWCSGGLGCRSWGRRRGWCRGRWCCRRRRGFDKGRGCTSRTSSKFCCLVSLVVVVQKHGRFYWWFHGRISRSCRERPAHRGGTPRPLIICWFRQGRQRRGRHAPPLHEIDGGDRLCTISHRIGSWSSRLLGSA